MIALLSFLVGALAAADGVVAIAMHLADMPSQKEIQLQSDLTCSQDDLTRTKDDLKDVRNRYEELRDRPESVLKQSRSAEDELRKIRMEIQELREEKQKSIRELQQLNQSISTVRNFRKAIFAIFGGEAIVGITSSKDGFQIIAEAESALANTAKRSVIRWRVPVYVNNTELGRELGVDYEVGDKLDSKDSERLANIYQTHRFVSPAPSNEAQLVHYKDLEVNVPRIGYYVRHDDQSMTLNTIDNGEELVLRTQVAPASAVRGEADVLVEAAEQLQFIDLCCLEIARRIGSPEGSKTIPPRVVVFVDCVAERGYARSHRRVPKDLGNLRVSSDVSESNTLDLKAWSREIEDTIYEGMVRLGVTVVERRMLEVIDRERALATSRKQSFQEELRLVGTHIFTCRVDLSAVTQSTRLSVRLVDIATDQDLWARSNTPSRPRGEEHSRFNVASGDLYLLNQQKKSKLQVETLFREPIGDGSSGSLENRLVIVERGIAPKGKTALRDPFSSQVYIVENRYIDKDRILPMRSGMDAPKDIALNYLSYSVFQSAMPRAGILIETSGDTATVRMHEADQIVDAGSNLPVYRTKENYRRADPPERLPRLLKVRDVTPKGMRVGLDGGRLTPVWSEHVTLKPGDVVVPSGQKPPTITVLGFSITQPTKQVWKEMKLGDPKVRQRVLDATEILTERLTTACDKIGFEVLPATYDLQNSARDTNRVKQIMERRGIEYLVAGTITPASSLQYEVVLTVADEDLDIIRRESVKVNSRQLEKWDPAR